MGVVYHTHFLDYFEAARTETFRQLGIVYKSLEADGIRMPVIDLAVQYKIPAFYDDQLDIKTLVREAPKTRVRFEYEVRRAGESALLASGHVTLCFIDTVRNRPIVAPDRVKSLIEKALLE